MVAVSMLMAHFRMIIAKGKVLFIQYVEWDASEMQNGFHVYQRQIWRFPRKRVIPAQAGIQGDGRRWIPAQNNA